MFSKYFWKKKKEKKEDYKHFYIFINIFRFGLINFLLMSH